MQNSLARANAVATETFSSIKTVRSFANEDGETQRYKQRLEETYSLNKQEAAAYAASTCTNSVSLSLVFRDLRIQVTHYQAVYKPKLKCQPFKCQMLTEACLNLKELHMFDTHTNQLRNAEIVILTKLWKWHILFYILKEFTLQKVFIRIDIIIYYK